MARSKHLSVCQLALEVYTSCNGAGIPLGRGQYTSNALPSSPGPSHKAATQSHWRLMVSSQSTPSYSPLHVSVFWLCVCVRVCVCACVCVCVCERERYGGRRTSNDERGRSQTNICVERARAREVNTVSNKKDRVGNRQRGTTQNKGGGLLVRVWMCLSVSPCT